MKSPLTKIFGSIFITASLFLASPALAIVIPYSVDGVAPQQYASPVTPPANAPWGVDGYPGDTVAFQAFSGTFDLSVGTSVQKINTLLWSVDYTYGGTATDPNAWSDIQFDLTAARQITIGTESAMLTQLGTLAAKWDNDYLGFSNGSTATIFYQGYQIDITPLATGTTGASDFNGSNPWTQPGQDVYAQFVVSEMAAAAAPEPGSVAALAALAVVICFSPFRKRMGTMAALLSRGKS